MSQSEQPLVSVVAPMFNEENNVAAFVAEVAAKLDAHQLSYELVLVDDGSRDATWQRICAEAQRDGRVRGISLSRNFGHQNALFAGLSHARGQAVVSMDGDLQHPPAVIPELVKAWREGHQVVTTTRLDSADTSWFKRITSRWFYRIFSGLTGVELSAGASDFRLVDARALRAILEMRDTDLFLRGIVSWVGFPTTSVSFQADPRHAGRTKYTLSRMIRLSTGAMLTFSMAPLKVGIWLGFGTSMLSVVGIVLVVLDYIYGNTVRGWSSVMVLMLMMFSVGFVLLGIIGSYIARIFEILKGRQRFIVGRYAGFEAEPRVSHRLSDPGA